MGGVLDFFVGGDPRDEAGKAPTLLNGVNQGGIDQANQQANQGLDQQQAFIQALQAQNGLGNQSLVFNQQQALAGQLGQMAQGGGPNPAAQQLANSTAQNVQNQAALMASQRGVGANPALLARQAAMQGGQIQQQAAGQAAVLNAQQQLSAIQALQSQQGAMANLSSQQAGQLQGATNAFQQGALGHQQGLLGALANQNTQNQAQYQDQYAQDAAHAANRGKVISAIAGGISGQTAMQRLSGAPSSDGGVSGGAEGGALGGAPTKMMPGGATGGRVPGKAMKKGDSLDNDVVPAVLSPGEIVLPRSVTQAKDPSKAAADFVAACMAKKGKKKS